jgi:hypothetical protein
MQAFSEMHPGKAQETVHVSSTLPARVYTREGVKYA